MTFKSKLHSLTLVLLASASTLALAQGLHPGGGVAVGGSGTIASPLQRPAMPALPAAPAVAASGAASALTGNTVGQPNGIMQAGTGILTDTVQDAGGATRGAANAASSAGAMAADGARPDARTGAAADASVKADAKLAPNRGHKKLRKSQGHSMSGEANASVNGGAAASTGQ